MLGKASRHEVQPKAKSHSQYPKGKMERTRNPRDVELAGVEVEGKLKDVVEETSCEALIRKKMIKDAYDDKDNQDDEKKIHTNENASWSVNQAYQQVIMCCQSSDERNNKLDVQNWHHR